MKLEEQKQKFQGRAQRHDLKVYLTSHKLVFDVVRKVSLKREQEGESLQQTENPYPECIRVCSRSVV